VILSINPKARILSCVRGAVPASLSLMGSSGAEGAASWGVLDEHRQLVDSIQKEEEKKKKVNAVVFLISHIIRKHFPLCVYL
jgi:hypothetical protein